MNVENMVKNFEAEPNDKGKEFQKIKVDKITDMSFDEAFKNTEKYLVFEVSSTKKLQEVMQDKDTEYLYFKKGDIVIKAKKEDISVENGKIYVYDFATLVLYWLEWHYEWGDKMVFKIKLKGKEIKKYTQILTIFTADNEDTGEKLLTIVTSGKSECYSMSEVEDFEIIGCGHCK